MSPATVHPANLLQVRHLAHSTAVDSPITICGAGALGGNLTETLARMGFLRLTVIDRDRVEARNLSTQPYSRGELGAPKARALAATLYRAVQAKITAVVEELGEGNAGTLLAGSTLVVDAFDNTAARGAVSAAARRLALPCLHVGFSPDGLYGSGAWEPGYRVPAEPPGNPCDQPLTRPVALVLTALAARAVTLFLRDGIRENFEITWADLRINRESV